MSERGKSEQDTCLISFENSENVSRCSHACAKQRKGIEMYKKVCCN